MDLTIDAASTLAFRADARANANWAVVLRTAALRTNTAAAARRANITTDVLVGLFFLNIRQKP